MGGWVLRQSEGMRGSRAVKDLKIWRKWYKVYGKCLGFL